MPAEIQRPVERLSPSPSFYGLQGRIELVGSGQDVLNIKNKTIVVTKDQLGKHEEQFQKILSAASTNERKNTWEQRGGAYEEQMDTWKSSFVRSIESRKDYFSQPGQEEFFKGIGVDIAHCDSVQAQEFYTTYFGGKNTESQTDVFIQAVLKQITHDGKIDATALKAHAEGIRCMALNFGKDGAEVIMQKLYGATELANNPDEFVRQTKNAVNAIVPNSREEQLILYLSKAQQNYVKQVEQEHITPIDSPQTPKISETPDKKGPAKPPIELKIDTDPHIKRREITPELARTNPKEFTQSLLEHLRNSNKRLYDVWKFAEQEGIVSEKNLKINPNQWMSESDSKDGITLGTAPMAEHEKYRILFEDQKFDYTSEVAYRFSHELSHKLVAHLALKMNDKSEYNFLVNTLMDLNIAKGKVLTPLTSTSYYKQRGPETQAIEDGTELMNMYLQDPAYLKRYLVFLADDRYVKLRKDFNLVHLDKDTGNALFDSVERELAPLFEAMRAKGATKIEHTNQQKSQDGQLEIKILEPEKAHEELVQMLPQPEVGKPDSVSLEIDNKAAAKQFIAELDVMTKESRNLPNSHDEGNLVTLANGIRRVDAPALTDVNHLRDKYFDYTTIISTAWNRYKLPIIFLNQGGHANLVLKIHQDPKNKDWNIVVYDPMRYGETGIDKHSKDKISTSPPIKIVIIPDKPARSEKVDMDIEITDNTNEVTSPIWRLLNYSLDDRAQAVFPTYADTDTPDEKAWHDFVARGEYDLTLQGDAELTQQQIASKVQAFQTEDAYNCVALSLWTGILRTAAKYSPDTCPEIYKPFLSEGLKQFNDDFHIQMKTRNQLIKK